MGNIIAKSILSQQRKRANSAALLNQARHGTDSKTRGRWSKETCDVGSGAAQRRKGQSDAHSQIVSATPALCVYFDSLEGTDRDRSCPAGTPSLKSIHRAPRTEPYQYGMGRKDRLVLSADAKPEMLKISETAPEDRLLPFAPDREHPRPWQDSRQLAKPRVTVRFVKTLPPSRCRRTTLTY